VSAAASENGRAQPVNVNAFPAPRGPQRGKRFNGRFRTDAFLVANLFPEDLHLDNKNTKKIRLGWARRPEMSCDNLAHKQRI
jgi:hypothetical protein